MSLDELNRRIQAVQATRRTRVERLIEQARLQQEQQYPELAKARSAAQDARWLYLTEATVHDSTRIERLEKELAEAEAALEALQKDLPPVTIPYKCSVCNDSGFVDSASCPACYPQILRQSLAELMPGMLTDPRANFASYREDVFSDQTIKLSNGITNARHQMAQNRKAADAFVSEFPKPGLNLFFTGKPGTGKTFLASCIANAILDSGHTALIVTMLQLEEIIARYRTLQLTYGVSKAELTAAETPYQWLLDTELLVIDDFGVMAKLLQEPLGEIIMLLQQRKIRGHQTIITTNIGLKDLGRLFDERLLSRIISAMNIYPFIGEDLRMRPQGSL